jgi:chemotaxis protein MotB
MRWLILALSLTACVPKKQHDALQAELEAARAAAASQQATLTTQVAERDGRIAALDGSLAVVGGRMDAVERRLGEVETRFQARIDALVEEKAQLLSDKSTLRSSVDEMTAALREQQAREAAAEARVREFTDLVGRFKQFIDAGQLQVKIVDGRMVIALATDILFDSGKAELSEAGRAQLRAVGAVLAGIPDRRFQVEGHTDNVPIRSDRFPSNWELASARAIGVVRELVSAGLAPDNVSGASFGEFRPVADNSTPEGKTANRRIEIVVLPDLSQLPGFDELRRYTTP